VGVAHHHQLARAIAHLHHLDGPPLAREAEGELAQRRLGAGDRGEGCATKEYEDHEDERETANL
jgi:hypothetical protein